MLEARNLYKTYNHRADRLQVLKGIDLKIEKGKFIVIIGPSGAGKTTLMHLLGGLDYPSKGEVFLEGQAIYALSDNRLADLRNRKIGFVFQFYHLLPEFNVMENTLFPGLIYRRRQDIKQQAQRLLGLVGLADRVDHFPNQLSGGELQRVAIARALINSPDLLFCDEPTGNLDSATGSQIVRLLRQLNHDRKMTVVLVTHNLELAKEADRTYRLVDGLLQ